MLVAQQLEAEGNLREAEKHYTDAKDWKAAVQMYRSQNLWDDALRVAKVWNSMEAARLIHSVDIDLCWFRPAGLTYCL